MHQGQQISICARFLGSAGTDSVGLDPIIPHLQRRNNLHLILKKLRFASKSNNIMPRKSRRSLRMPSSRSRRVHGSNSHTEQRSMTSPSTNSAYHSLTVQAAGKMQCRNDDTCIIKLIGESKMLSQTMTIGLDPIRTRHCAKERAPLSHGRYARVCTLGQRPP